ncbi:MAG TPA: hypothetical protein VFS21_04140 [Roseiflexaceae bacterium]|nr:hypothetical protein [Roseiflexaceae bacterium]
MDERADDTRRFPDHFPGLQQMISYALANPAFAEDLVRDPPAALAHLPAEICLNREEYALVKQMPCTASLHWFAAHLYALIEAARLPERQRSAGEL